MSQSELHRTIPADDRAPQDTFIYHVRCLVNSHPANRHQDHQPTSHGQQDESHDRRPTLLPAVQSHDRRPTSPSSQHRQSNGDVFGEMKGNYWRSLDLGLFGYYL